MLKYLKKKKSLCLGEPQQKNTMQIGLLPMIGFMVFQTHIKSFNDSDYTVQLWICLPHRKVCGKGGVGAIVDGFGSEGSLRDLPTLLVVVVSFFL